MSEVSVRPELLQTFYDVEKPRGVALDGAISAKATAFITFVNSPGGDCAMDGVDLVTTKAPALAKEHIELATFAKLTRDAVIAADHSEVNGVFSANPAAVAGQMRRIAQERGIDLRDVSSTEPPMTAERPTVTTVPQDSGYVNDPVATATGNLVIAAQDLVLPPRLRVLGFERFYGSDVGARGVFGPGWWAWTEVRAERRVDGGVHFTSLEGGELAIAGDGETWTAPEALDLRVAAAGDGGLVVRWGPRSRHPFEAWHFDLDGRIVAVEGVQVGTNHFAYAGDRLVAITHDSGRAVELEWADERIVALHASDGRHVHYGYDELGRLVAVDNALNPETYTLDGRGRILTITDGDGVVVVTNEYDDAGRVVRQLNAKGKALRYQYTAPRRTTMQHDDGTPMAVYVHDERGRVELTATADGMRLSRTFDDAGRVVFQQDPEGRSFRLRDVPADAGRAEELTWSTGEVERFEFDAQDRLTSATSRGVVARMEYADDSPLPRGFHGADGWRLDVEWAYGMPSRIEDADGVVTQLAINPDGTIAASTDGVGTVVVFDVHPSGAVATAHLPDGNVVHHERDDAGRILAVSDSSGARWTVEYTPAGRLRRITDARGAVTTFGYDETGSRTTVSSADGTVTDWLTNDDGRPAGLRFADGSSIELQLDDFGRPLGLTLEAGQHWSVQRDHAGRIVRLTDPTGRHAQVDHADGGRRITGVDGSGRRDSWQLDLLDHVSSLVRADGSTDTFQCDANGMLVGRTDLAGSRLVRERTPAGRIVAETVNDVTTRYRHDAAGAVSAFSQGDGWWQVERDAVGRISRITSPEGRVRSWRYDLSGRVVEADVAGAVWRYRYDPCGNMIGTTDPTERTTSYEYDLLGQMIACTDGAGATTRYTYTVRGRLASMTDPAGAVTTYGGGRYAFATTTTDPLGRTTTYEFDAAGRHVATAYADGSRTIDDLDDAGLVSRRRLSDGSSVEFRRDSLGRVIDLVETEPSPSGPGSVHGGRLAERPPRQDAPDLLLSMQRDADGLVVRLTTDGFERRWERDERGLITEIVEVVDGRSSVTCFVRDAAGRILRRDVDGVFTSYEYDAGGRLTALREAGVEWSWRYDLVGRLVEETGPGGSRRFAYDAAHQLVAIDEPAGRTTFSHDARGRRTASAGTSTCAYLWDDNGLRGYIRDGRRGTSAMGDAGYPQMVDGEALEWDRRGPLPMPTRLGGWRAVTAGTLAIGMIDEDGTVRWTPQQSPTPWGDDTADGVAWHAFHGISNDGLIWLGARVYDVATRQFLSPDPLTPKPGQTSGTWGYSYAGNDPINFFDPSGNQGVPLTVDQFNDIRERATSVQWGNIAMVAVVVVGVVATVATGGAAAGLLIGVAAGAGSEFARQAVNNATHTGPQGWDPGAIVKAGVVGLIGGGAGMAFTKGAAIAITRAGGPALMEAIAGGSTVIPKVMTNVVRPAIEEGAESGVEGLVGEVYDVTMPRSWGADGSFDGNDIVTNAATGAVTGPLVHNVGNRVHPEPTPTTPRPPEANGPDTHPPAGNPNSSPASRSAAGHPTSSIAPAGDGPAHSTTPGDATPSGHTTAPAAAGTPHPVGTDAPSGNGSAHPTGDATTHNAPSSGAPDASSGDATTHPTGDATPSHAPSSSTPAETTGAHATPSHAPTTDAPSGNGSGRPAPDVSPSHARSSSTPAETTGGHATPSHAPTSSAPAGDPPSGHVAPTHHPAGSADSAPTHTPPAHSTAPAGDASAPSHTAPAPPHPGAAGTTSTTPTGTHPTPDHVPAAAGDSRPSTHPTPDQAPVTAGDAHPTDAHPTPAHTTATAGDTHQPGPTPGHAPDPAVVPTHVAATAAAAPSTAPTAAPGTSTTAPHGAAPSTTPAGTPASGHHPTSTTSNGSPSPANGTAGNGHTPTPSRTTRPMPDRSGTQHSTPPNSPDRVGDPSAPRHQGTIVPPSASDVRQIPGTFRGNDFVHTVDANGHFQRVQMTIRNGHSKLARSSAERTAQRAAGRRGGRTTDQGGHGAAHSVVGDQGNKNLFPQDGHFNNSDYKRMENELKDWTRHGYEVDAEVRLTPPGAVRPDHVEVSYVVTNPKTGEIVFAKAHKFQNEHTQVSDPSNPSQTGDFERVGASDMGWVH